METPSEVVDRQARAFLLSDEMKQYAAVHDQILTAATTELGAISDNVSRIWLETTSKLEKRKGVVDKITRARARLATLRALLIGGIITFVVLGWLVRPIRSYFRLHLVTLLPLSIFAIGVVVGVLVYRPISLKRSLDYASAQYFDSEAQLSRVRRDTEARVERVLRPQVQNFVFTPQHFTLRVSAPALVESIEDKPVPSKALERCRQFIEHHSTSAVGIAGSRGSGKSTVLHKLVDESSDKWRKTVAVHVATPVSYSPNEMAPFIFEEFLSQTLRHYEIPRLHSDRPYGLQKVLPATSGGVIFVFASVVALLVAKLSYNEPDFTLLQGFSILLGTIGIAMIFWALLSTVTSRSVWLRKERRDSLGGLPGETDRAIYTLRQATNSLRWKYEWANSSKQVYKVLASQAEISGDASVKATGRDVSRPELASEFKRAVTEYLDASRRHDRIIVCIDELDKISDPGAAPRLINEIKDLMHVRGLHFVVAVSTDALDSFSLRGYPLRDEIDSTFDDVFRVPNLTIQESVQMIASRAATFPTPLAVFAHIWAGGLARDVIRNARHCVEVRSGVIDTSDYRGIVGEVMAADIAAAAVSVCNQDGLKSRLTPEGRQIYFRLSEGTSGVGPDDTSSLASSVAEIAFGPEAEALRMVVALASAVNEVYDSKMSYGEWERIAQPASSDVESVAFRKAAEKLSADARLRMTTLR